MVSDLLSLCPIGWKGPQDSKEKCLDCQCVFDDLTCGFDRMYGDKYRFVWAQRKWPAIEYSGDKDEKRDLRRGQRCKLLAARPANAGGPNNMAVEFFDGTRMVGTKFCARKVR